MDLGITNRVALVGGSTRGIGRACAEFLAREGARVAVCGRNPTDLDRAVKELESLTEVAGVQADLAAAAGVRAFVSAALDQLGPPEILVVNAGGPQPGELEDLDDGGWQKAFDLTLMSGVRLCNLVGPYMKKQRWGRVVFLSSISVIQVLDNMVLSNTLRSGVHALAKTLSRRWGPCGITVNTVCTGYTRTGRVENLARTMSVGQGITEKEVMDRWKLGIPVGRLADPAEIAACVTFLASEPASYITGASISADGGYTSCV